MYLESHGRGVLVTPPDRPAFRLDYDAVRWEWDRDGMEIRLLVRRGGRWDLIEVLPAGTDIRRAS